MQLRLRAAGPLQDSLWDAAGLSAQCETFGKQDKLTTRKATMGCTLFRLPKSFTKQAAPRFSTSAQSIKVLRLRQTAMFYTGKASTAV